MFSVSQRSYQLPFLSLILPCLQLTVIHPDRSRSNRGTCPVKWLSCKYKTTRRKTSSCVNSFNALSSFLESDTVWIMSIMKRGDISDYKGGEWGTQSVACVPYVCGWVTGLWKGAEALNCNSEMIFISTKQEAQIVQGKIYGNSHKRWRLQKWDMSIKLTIYCSLLSRSETRLLGGMDLIFSIKRS